MLNWLLGLAPPRSEAGKLVFETVLGVRKSMGHSPKKHLPNELSQNPEFIGLILALMDAVSGKTGERKFLRTNSIELLEMLFGRDANGNRTHGAICAVQIMTSGDSRVVDATYEVGEILEDSRDVENDVYQLLAQFF